MNPEDIMLSEMSQTQKDKCCLIPLKEKKKEKGEKKGKKS